MLLLWPTSMHRMMVFCISWKYPTKMVRYASDMLEFYRRTVLDGLNMGCSVPTIPMGRSRPKGCMFMVKKTDFGQSIIQTGKWPREGTTRMAKRWAIGSSGVAMARRKKARTTPPRLMYPLAAVEAVEDDRPRSGGAVANSRSAFGWTREGAYVAGATHF